MKWKSFVTLWMSLRSFLISLKHPWWIKVWNVDLNVIFWSEWTGICLCPSGWHCFPSFWAFPSRLCLVTPSLLLQECCTDSHPLERSELVTYTQNKTCLHWVTLQNTLGHYWLNDGLCASCVSEVMRWATLDCSTRNRAMMRSWRERQTVQCRESHHFTPFPLFSLHVTTCITWLSVSQCNLWPLTARVSQRKSVCVGFL